MTFFLCISFFRDYFKCKLQKSVQSRWPGAAWVYLPAGGAVTPKMKFVHSEENDTKKEWKSAQLRQQNVQLEVTTYVNYFKNRYP